MRPVVSVVIPTYNRAHIVGEAIESVLAQEGKGDLFDLEVVVVDDASTDSTDATVARYPATYIKHGMNRGVAAALNTGVEASRGVYVGILGDDDLWLPGKLRVQVPVLESRPDVGLVYSSHMRAGAEEAWTIGPSGHVFGELLRGLHAGPSPHTVLVRRSAFMEVGGHDISVTGIEDYDLWLRLAHRFKFQFVPGPVAVYRPSQKGLFSTTVATGARRPLHRRVIARALTLVPDASPELVQEVTDRMELNNARNLVHLPGHVALPQMLTHFGEYPRLSQHKELLDWIIWAAREESIASTNPLHTAATVCTHIELAVGDLHLARCLIGAVWAEVAVGLARKRRGNQALRAAREAVRHDFPGFVRRGFASFGRAIHLAPSDKSSKSHYSTSALRRANPGRLGVDDDPDLRTHG